MLSRKSGVPSSALDAHRGEVFLRLERLGSEACGILAGARELAAIDPAPCAYAVCDDGCGILLASAWPDAELVQTAAPTAADALRLGEARLVAGMFADLALLDGHYLRRSDAEIFGDSGRSQARVARRMNPAVQNSCRFGPMTAADLDRVMEIAAEPARMRRIGREQPTSPRSNPESTPQRIALVAAEPHAANGDRLCGGQPHAAASRTGNDCRRRRSQRRGLGQQALRARWSMSYAERRAYEILLEVRASNQAALGFYRSLGFSETGRRPGYYADPVEDAVLMRL